MTVEVAEAGICGVGDVTRATPKYPGMEDVPELLACTVLAAARLSGCAGGLVVVATGGYKSDAVSVSENM